MEEYRLTRRGGKGIITMKTTDKTGRVIGVRMVTDDDQIMLVTSGGKVIRLRVNEIRVIGRNTQGVRLIGLEEGERVASVARLAERVDGDGSTSNPPSRLRAGVHSCQPSRPSHGGGHHPRSVEVEVPRLDDPRPRARDGLREGRCMP